MVWSPLHNEKQLLKVEGTKYKVGLILPKGKKRKTKKFLDYYGPDFVKKFKEKRRKKETEKGDNA